MSIQLWEWLEIILQGNARCKGGGFRRLTQLLNAHFTAGHESAGRARVKGIVVQSPPSSFPISSLQVFAHPVRQYADPAAASARKWKAFTRASYREASSHTPRVVHMQASDTGDVLWRC